MMLFNGNQIKCTILLNKVMDLVIYRHFVMENYYITPFLLTSKMLLLQFICICHNNYINI